MFLKSRIPVFVTLLLASANPVSAQGQLSMQLYGFGREIQPKVTMDISAYVYHDTNRNGIYDIGDRSMAEVVVVVGGEGKTVAATKTNMNGFANFPTNGEGEGANIPAAGSYEFVVVPPPGTKVTSGNATQVIDISEMPGNPELLRAARMPEPIGIAPYTYVRGTYGGALPAKAKLLQGDDVVGSVEVNPDGQFLIPVEPGIYTLRTGTLSRPVKVESYPVDVGLVQSFTALPEGLKPLDFEGLAPLGLQKVPNGYGGMGWFNFNAMGAQTMSGSVGYQNGATSGTTIAYSSSAHPVELSNEAGFGFLQANLSVAWPEGEGEELLVEYYRGDERIATDTVALSAYTPVSYQPMMENVTFIRFTPTRYWQVVFDDMVLRVK